MMRRLVVFIAVFQGVLFLAHAFLYETWTLAARRCKSYLSKELLKQSPMRLLSILLVVPDPTTVPVVVSPL
jgi:uncharacterized membrane protein